MEPETSEQVFKSAEEILTVKDIREVVVYVPEWETHVRLRTLSKGRQQACRRESVVITDGRPQLDTDKFEMAMLKQAIAEPVFSPEQFEKLLDKSEAAIRRLLDAYAEMSGTSASEAKAIKKSFT
jgi:hypothetical protein